MSEAYFVSIDENPSTALVLLSWYWSFIRMVLEFHLASIAVPLVWDGAWTYLMVLLAFYMLYYSYYI